MVVFCGNTFERPESWIPAAVAAIGDPGLEGEKGPFIYWILATTYQPPKEDNYCLITSERVFFFRFTYFTGKVKPSTKIELNKKDINDIVISELDYRHITGAVWTDYIMLSVTFNMKDGQRFERYLPLGRNESEINAALPGYVKTIELLQKIYPVSYGSTRAGSGGYTMGVWFPFPN
jgi:hypothetical protein